MSTTVTCTIDNQRVTVEAGTTILEAAVRIGVRIPTLCHHPWLSTPGCCRVCIVDVREMGYYMPACSVPVWEGMEVRTNSPEIRQARRDIVELICDNHPMDCQTCERDGHCELQNLAYAMGVRERLFAGERKRRPMDLSSAAVVRDPEKCVLCGRCVRVCAEIQGVHNLAQQHRGFGTIVTPAHERGMDESVCIQCGQCVNVCPTAAFLEKSHAVATFEALEDPRRHVVCQTAPSIRAAIGEAFGLPPGTPATGRMITALRRLGFSKVFDTDLGADMTIIEESHEFLGRLRREGPLPMFTSCSPGWISFMEKFYPELISHASTCRSPMTMLSVLAKTYYASLAGIAPGDVHMVAVMPCTAKKFEAQRPELRSPDGFPWTDAVITTRELIWMIKSYGIDFAALPEGSFDEPLGLATGAGDIFGITGGVMEATLRTACERFCGERCNRLEFTDVRNVAGLREARIQLGDTYLNVAVANGLGNAHRILRDISDGRRQLHIVEIMACPGGCSGGGGQPYPHSIAGTTVLEPDLLWTRGQALYAIDEAKPVRRSHENPLARRIYRDFIGEPGGAKAHELLHTRYQARLPRGTR